MSFQKAYLVIALDPDCKFVKPMIVPYKKDIHYKVVDDELFGDAAFSEDYSLLEFSGLRQHLMGDFFDFASGSIVFP